MRKLLKSYINEFLNEELVNKSNYRGYEIPSTEPPRSQREWEKLYLDYFNDARSIGLSILDASDHAEKEVEIEKAKQADRIRHQKRLFTPKLESFVHEIVKKCGSEYCLMSHKGKRLGKHSSKKKAKAQEKAIQISKARAAGHNIPKK